MDRPGRLAATHFHLHVGERAAELFAFVERIALESVGSKSWESPRSLEGLMFKHAAQVLAFLLLASFITYSAFAPRHAWSGYGIDDAVSHANLAG